MASKATGSRSTTANAGGAPSNSRLSSLKGKSKKGHTGWDDCSPQLLQEVIARTVRQGALISFSQTTDGGALVLYVKDGIEELKEYPASPDELTELLEGIHETYDL